MENPKILRNAIWLIGGKSLQLVLDLLVGLLTARYLSPDNLGRLQYGAAYAGLVAVFCNLGLPNLLVQSLSQEPEKEGEILGTAWLLRGVSSVLTSWVVLLLVFWRESADSSLQVMVFGACLGLGLQMSEGFSDWLQCRRQSKAIAVSALLAHILAVVYKGALLLTGQSAEWFSLATAVEQSALGGLFLLAYGRQGGGKLAVSWNRAKDLLHRGCPFLLPGFLVAIYGQADKLLLGAMLGQQELGYYTLAVSLCGVWCFVLTAIIAAAGPEITAAYRQDKQTFLRRNRQLYSAIFYLSAAVSALLCCFAEPLILLLYGQDYLPAVKPLRVLTWYTGFSYLGVARNLWVVCEDRQRYLIWVYALGALVNVVLNVGLIPLWGTVGAAAGALAAQVVTALLGPLLVPGLRDNGKLMLSAILLQDIWNDREEKPWRNRKLF